MAKQYIMTPFAPVVWASTNKPSKPYEEGAEPMYELRLLPTPEQVTKFKADIMAMIGNVAFEGKKPRIGVSVSEDGVVTILAKSKYKPTVFDAKNNQLVGARIGKGSIVRAECELNVWKKGVGLRLISIQVKELAEYAAADPDAPRQSRFEATDGYVAEAATEEAPATEGGTSALDI